MLVSWSLHPDHSYRLQLSISLNWKETTHHSPLKNPDGTIIPNIQYVFCCFLTTHKKDSQNKSLADQQADFTADT